MEILCILEFSLLSLLLKSKALEEAKKKQMNA